MPVTCGNRARHADGKPAVHADVTEVRECYLGPQTWRCDWLFGVRHPEDGEIYAVPCGARAWYLPAGRGYTCAAGHEHIYAEVRAAEGFDYAADEVEAGLLAGRGVRPVAMNGGPIDIDTGAFRYAAGLTPTR